MIRTAIAVFLVVALATAILAITGEPGSASIIWLGWRADMTAAAMVLITLIAALLAMIGWRLLLWILEAPRRAERARAEDRRRQANEALTRGFLAAAAGEGSEARRLALKAADLADEAPGLVRVLAAQAAEAAGDAVAVQAAYSAMLGFPEMRLAGHKGLMAQALAQGDKTSALRHAEQAYEMGRTARWAWRAVLEARLEAGDWEGALDLVKSALDRRIVSPIVAERARAALLAASAAQLENAAEPKARSQATDFAVEAAKLQPGFAPGVVMAGRLLAADGKTRRAAQVLETAWKIAPHPALWLAYRDLNTNETPRQRAERLNNLAELNPTARESRILFVEQALIDGVPSRAREAAKALEDEPLTIRIAGLFARVAFAAGRPAGRGPAMDGAGRGRAPGAGLDRSRPRGPGLRLPACRLGAADRGLCRDRRVDPPAPRAGREDHERAAGTAGSLYRLRPVPLGPGGRAAALRRGGGSL